MRRRCFGTNTPRSVSTSVWPSTATRPRSGRIRPPTISTSVVLPEPERPNSAVTPGCEVKRAARRKVAARVLDVDVEAHVATCRAPMRRASSSEPSRAAIEIAIDTSVSRSAPASPPGIWVRV